MRAYEEISFGKWKKTDVSGTIRAAGGSYGGGSETLIMEDGTRIITTSKAGYHTKVSENIAETLVATDYKGPPTVTVVREGDEVEKVRRLTPLEAERLQGFPDGWTDIGDWVDSKGKQRKSGDSLRYKALGNSIALPFWEWMAKRMVSQLAADGVEHPTMASLFDGIGGFPLVYSRAGCEPIWASEIEEFPIAVTKIHFPEKEPTP